MAGRPRDVVVASTGIAFFVVLLSVVMIPHEKLPEHEPADGADGMPTSDEIQAFFEDNYAMQQAQTFLHIVAAGLFLVFATTLTARIDQAATRRWSQVAFAAALVTATIIVVAMTMVSALVERHGSIDGRTLLFFYDAAWSLHFRINYVVPIFLGAVAIAGLRGRMLPAWLCWAAVVVGALTFASTLGNLSPTATFLQFPPFFLLMLWVLAVGIVAATKGIGPAAIAPSPPSPSRPVLPVARPVPVQRPPVR